MYANPRTEIVAVSANLEVNQYTRRLELSCLHAALVVGYETLARVKLSMLKVDECPSAIQLGIEAIEKCKAESLFGNGKGFFQVIRTFILHVNNKINMHQQLSTHSSSYSDRDTNDSNNIVQPRIF